MTMAAVKHTLPKDNETVKDDLPKQQTNEEILEEQMAEWPFTKDVIKEILVKARAAGAQEERERIPNGYDYCAWRKGNCPLIKNAFEKGKEAGMQIQKRTLIDRGVKQHKFQVEEQIHNHLNIEDTTRPHPNCKFCALIRKGAQEMLSKRLVCAKPNHGNPLEYCSFCVSDVDKLYEELINLKDELCKAKQKYLIEHDANKHASESISQMQKYITELEEKNEELNGQCYRLQKYMNRLRNDLEETEKDVTRLSNLAVKNREEANHLREALEKIGTCHGCEECSKQAKNALKGEK